jgi:uridine kinase
VIFIFPLYLTPRLILDAHLYVRKLHGRLEAMRSMKIKIRENGESPQSILEMFQDFSA